MIKYLSRLIHYVRYKGYMRLEREYNNQQKQHSSAIQAKMIEDLNNALNYAKTKSDYYNEIIPNKFKITKIEDLSKLMILTKSDIRNNYDRLIIRNEIYKKGSTGGSTGSPMKYYMSKDDYLLGLLNLNKGRELGGYTIGDKLLTIAGSSLISTHRSKLRNKVLDFLMNIRHVSSYGMDDQDLKNYVNKINQFKPRFIRGYASSIYILAKYIDRNKLEIKANIKSIFSTSEMLEKKKRDFIESIFNAEVFDQYGLNDGGLSAFECKVHNGFHVDTNRAILEVVDENGNLVYDKPGRILATSLHNKAMPFIRYETGDIGILSTDVCSCGTSKPLLKSLLGRTTDYLDINGMKIGSPVLTVLMGTQDIEMYQIIQKSSSKLLFKILPGKNYSSMTSEEFIIKSIQEHVGSCEIEFCYVDDASLFNIKNKHKFIFKEY